MRVEEFFEKGIAESLKSSGVQRMVPLEIGIGELLARFDGKNYRIIDPEAHSNTERPFIHDDGIGRYAVLREGVDPECSNLEVLMILTRVDEAGVEGNPFVLDRDVDKLGSFIFE